MDDADDIDSRLLYMMNLVSNCIKIKPDKWHKMMSNEQYKVSSLFNEFLMPTIEKIQ